MIDNAVLHYYPLSPWIAKAEVNLRAGNKIVMRAVLRDDETGKRFLRERFADIPYRVIVHA